MNYRHRKKLCSILYFLFCIEHYCFSQNKENNFVIEGYVLGGINYNYTSLAAPNKILFNRTFSGIAFNIGEQSDGTHLWHQRFNYPLYGLGVSYFNISKNKIVGNPISLYSYIDIPLKWSKNKFRFITEGGLAYFVNHKDLFYDLDKNPVVGSLFNFHLGMNFSFSIPIGTIMQSNVGVKLQHYSNGTIRTPNFGVNLIAISANLQYNSLKGLIEQQPINVFSQEPRQEFSISPAFAFTTHREQGVPNQYFAILNMDYWRRLVYINYINFGINIYYDASMHKKGSKNTTIYPGIHIGYKVKANRLSFIGQSGFMLKKRLDDSGRFFTKIGVTYRIRPKFHAGVFLKSKQSLAADFVEWSVAFGF